MNGILIVYATSHGQTLAIAQAIATRLRNRGHIVELADANSDPPPPSDYAAVILGSRVEFGKHASAIVRYIETNWDALRLLPTSFFSVNNAVTKSSHPDPLGYLERLFLATNWRPRHAIAFGGGLPYRKYGWLLRNVMKLVSKRIGHPTDTSRDFVFTRWDAVDRFADEAGSDLAAQMPKARRFESVGVR